jgi:hypothetical protein
MRCPGTRRRLRRRVLLYTQKTGDPVFLPLPESLKLVLDAPVVRFGSDKNTSSDRSSEFDLKKPLAELFEYIRGVDDGEIRHLEVRHGLPFSMEVEHRISRGMRISKRSMLKLFERNGRGQPRRAVALPGQLHS